MIGETSDIRDTSFLNLLNVSQSITGVEESPTNAERCPQFVQIPGAQGRICLWHFPSQKQLQDVAKQGCKCVVTLQSLNEDPHMKLIPQICQIEGMQWIQVSFWPNFYSHAGAEGHGALIKLIDEIATKVKNGEYVMLHCAAGIHRTGMCVYGVLRKLGLSQQQTLNCIRDLRRATFDHCGMDRFTEMESKIKVWFK